MSKSERKRQAASAADGEKHSKKQRADVKQGPRIQRECPRCAGINGDRLDAKSEGDEKSGDERTLKLKAKHSTDVPAHNQSQSILLLNRKKRTGPVYLESRLPPDLIPCKCDDVSFVFGVATITCSVRNSMAPRVSR